MKLEQADNTDLLLRCLCNNAPLALASWLNNDDTVYVSKKMRTILKISENPVSRHDFIYAAKHIFRNFLDVAVEQIFNKENTSHEHSSLIEATTGENYNLSIALYPKEDIFIFTAKNHETNIDSSMLNAVIDKLPIYIWQQKNERITYCNKKYADAFKTSKIAAISNNLKLIEHSNEAKFRAQFRPTIETSKQNVKLDNKKVTMEVTEIPSDDNQSLTAFALDITGKERAESELKNCKQNISAALSKMAIPIAIFNEQEKLSFANAPLAALFGVSDISKYIGWTFDRILRELMDDGKIMNLASSNENESTNPSLTLQSLSSGHAHIYLANGADVSVNAAPIGSDQILLTLSDTQQLANKRSDEQELNLPASVQNIFLNKMTDACAILDANCMIYAANPTFCDKFGKPAFSEIHLTDFFKSAAKYFKSVDALETCIAAICNAASQNTRNTGKLSLANDTEMDWECTPLSQDLCLLEFRTMQENVNESLDVERASNDAVLRMDDLKNTMLSNIQFGIEIPLNTIRGFTEILKTQYIGELNEKQEKYCDEMLHAAKSLTQTVQAIMELTSIEACHRKIERDDVQIGQFIDDVISWLKPELDARKINVRTLLSTPDITAHFDRASLQQSLFYIVLRVMSATPNCGKITVTASKSANHFKLSVLGDDSTLDDEKLEKIKEVLARNFSIIQADEPAEFGLMLANSIAKLHKGSLEISSDQSSDAGIIITLTIPLKDPT